MKSFLPGETVRAEARFLDLAGAALAVTGVAMILLPPSGVEATIDPGAVFEDSDGVYHTDVLVETPGRYRLRVTCTGPSAAAVETAWNVVKSAFA